MSTQNPNQAQLDQAHAQAMQHAQQPGHLERSKKSFLAMVRETWHRMTRPKVILGTAATVAALAGVSYVGTEVIGIERGNLVGDALHVLKYNDPADFAKRIGISFLAGTGISAALAGVLCRCTDEPDEKTPAATPGAPQNAAYASAATPGLNQSQGYLPPSSGLPPQAIGQQPQPGGQAYGL